MFINYDSISREEGKSNETEIRVEPGEPESNVNQSTDAEIIRVSEETNVVVLAAILLNDKFMQNTTMSSDSLNQLLFGSDK